jgi:hypothetical protein
MFCSNCGSPAEGNYCSGCGAALAVLPASGWEYEVRYAVLVRVPQVRLAIEAHARTARKGISGEQFLALCEKTLPGGAPLELLASVVQPIYASWGIGTGKQRSATFEAPIGRMLLHVLCSLARHGQVVRQVQQASDGCLIEAALPSDLWSLEGDLLISVQKQLAGTQIQAATKIKGQLFDWGKSTRCLDRLFADLPCVPDLVGDEPLRRVA